MSDKTDIISDSDAAKLLGIDLPTFFLFKLYMATGGGTGTGLATEASLLNLILAVITGTQNTSTGTGMANGQYDFTRLQSVFKDGFDEAGQGVFTEVASGKSIFKDLDGFSVFTHNNFLTSVFKSLSNGSSLFSDGDGESVFIDQNYNLSVFQNSLGGGSVFTDANGSGVFQDFGSGSSVFISPVNGKGVFYDIDGNSVFYDAINEVSIIQMATLINNSLVDSNTGVTSGNNLTNIDDRLQSKNIGKISVAATTNSTLLKSGVCWLDFLNMGQNNNGQVKYLKVVDKATAPIAGIDVPKFVFVAPSLSNNNYIQGAIKFTNGLGVFVVTGILDSDATAPSAAGAVVNYGYSF